MIARRFYVGFLIFNKNFFIELMGKIEPVVFTTGFLYICEWFFIGY